MPRIRKDKAARSYAEPFWKDVYKRQAPSVFKRVNRSCPGTRQEIYLPVFIS